MPIARLLGILAAWFVTWAAEKGITLSEAELLVLFMSVYGGVHSLWRNWRKKKTGEGTE